MRRILGSMIVFGLLSSTALAGVAGPWRGELAVWPGSVDFDERAVGAFGAGAYGAERGVW
ncbi:MAG: hypothetical protein LRY39_00575 [Alphaproteobacteria bacterium]|nr:hypothetical protein [Alphaproteobacteria bacterium]